MYGVFNFQLVVGNTSLNKMLSTTRSKINTSKLDGQCVYIKIDGKYKLLTMPSIYEIGVNYAKWFYKIEEDIIVIKSYSLAYKSDIVLEINSEKNKKYKFIITNQIVMGEHEHQNDFYIEQKGNFLIFTLGDDSFVKNVYKDLSYILEIRNTDFILGNDSIFYKDNKCRNKSFITIKTNATNSLQCIISGNLYNLEFNLLSDYNFEKECKNYIELYKRLSCNFNLQFKDKKDDELDKINEIF